MGGSTAVLFLLTSVGCSLLPTSSLHAQVSERAALASATAEALEPGVRAALRDGGPISFEYQSDWGQTVKRTLEEALGTSLTAEHRRGASRILLSDPRGGDDSASVDVWFGRCEARADAEILKIRMYSFTFRRDGNEWILVRASRLGTTEGSCDAEQLDRGTVQARGSAGAAYYSSRFHHATAVASSSIISSGSNSRATPRSVHAGLQPSAA